MLTFTADEGTISRGKAESAVITESKNAGQRVRRSLYAFQMNEDGIKKDFRIMALRSGA